MNSLQYQQQSKSLGDHISQLPVDQSQPTNNELQIINSLFNTTNKSTINILLREAKDSIIIGILFIIFSLPYTDSLVKRIVGEKSPYILVGIKVVIVMALYWLIKHFYLSRKDN